MKVILRGIPGEAYNIGNPKPELSVLDLVKWMEGVHGKPIKYKVIEYPDSYPSDEPQRRCPDIRKANSQLDYFPIVDLNDGLKRFLTWSDSVYSGEI